MKRALLSVGAAVALVAAAHGCADPNAAVQAPYAYNDLQLLTAFTAKEICSCVFVMHRDETFCERFARQSPNVKTFRVDRVNNTVEAQAVVFWSAHARYTGPHGGCVLE